MDYRNNVFTFATHKMAISFVNKIYKYFDLYDGITLADLHTLLDPTYIYNSLEGQVFWSKDTLTAEEGEKCPIWPQYDSYKDWWYVKFPEPDQYPACEPTYHNTKETPTPEPLNITINMDTTNITHATIQKVLTEANKIKDRPVFITIN